MVASSHIPRLSSIVFLLSTVFLLLILVSCGGSNNSNPVAPPGDDGDTPANVGGGFTLLASGGTINDGTGIKGLSILATLRDSLGRGPTQTWTITVTGPGMLPDDYLAVEYSDPRPGSFMNWKWAAFDPLPGVYRATATNGSTTIYYDFAVASDVLSRPAPTAAYSGNAITITWPAVIGAGSYSYEICSPSSMCFSGITAGTSETVGFETLAAGDYLIFVSAGAVDRIALNANHTPATALAPERVSEYFFTYPVGAAVPSADYELKAAGGILDYGMSTPAGPVYGLAIWTSLQNTTTNPDPSAPSGNWNIVITDPGGFVTNYIYPAGNRHYAYWYYGIEPVAGTYHMLATHGTASTTTTFTVGASSPELTPRLDPPTGISAAKSLNDDIAVTWNPVSGAGSYYVSFYSVVWDEIAGGYDYREVWSEWVSTAGVTILKSAGILPAGLQCDVYITAHEANMLSAAPPAALPSRADMSENYYGYELPFLTP